MTERILRPRQPFELIAWRRLLHYRDLLFILVRRDFVARYQQTILGPAWFILQPLIATCAFTLVFGRSLGLSTDGLPAFPFYLCGMLIWGYFSNVFSGAGNIFQTNAQVFTKVNFPRLIVPLAIVLGGIVPFLLQLALFLAFYVPALLVGPAWHPRPDILALLPLCVAEAAAFTLGLSLLTSGLSAKYRDLQHALPFLVQMGLFATPVIYPLSRLSPHARVWAELNPLTAMVESFRLGFFGVGTVNPRLAAISAVTTALVLIAGLIVFQRAERTFADHA